MSRNLHLLPVLFTVLMLGGCEPKEEKYQGWVEANLIFVGPDETGRVEELSVREGDQVTEKGSLFVLDSELQRADVAMAESSVRNAQQAFERAQKLLVSAVGTQKTYDDAEAALRSAQARLNSAQTRLQRRRILSPVSGTVQQVYFRPGEMVQTSRPIVALLPPGNMKVRFFVAEPLVRRFAYGDAVTVRCDGCSDVTAHVSFIAKQAEYTPPVIYSREERAKLVFMLEALPEQPERLRVGQPVDVFPRPAPAEPGVPVSRVER